MFQRDALAGNLVALPCWGKGLLECMKEFRHDSLRIVKATEVLEGNSEK